VAENRYTSQAVLTASPGQLVVMLYEGFGRFANRGAEALAAGDLPTAATALGRATDIVTELRVTLDPAAGEIAERLDAIYDWVSRELAAGQRAKDPARIRSAAELMDGLRGAWVEAAKKVPDPRGTATRGRMAGVDLAG